MLARSGKFPLMPSGPSLFRQDFATHDFATPPLFRWQNHGWQKSWFRIEPQEHRKTASVESGSRPALASSCFAPSVASRFSSSTNVSAGRPPNLRVHAFAAPNATPSRPRASRCSVTTTGPGNVILQHVIVEQHIIRRVHLHPFRLPHPLRPVVPQPLAGLGKR